MIKYLNQSNIPLSLAVFLATDTYDHDDTTVSATQIIRPLRQLILADRVPPGENVVDISSLIASRTGTAIHEGFDNAWTSNYAIAMRRLNYPDSVIDKIRINPTGIDATDPDLIQVYLEQRFTRELIVGNTGTTLSGKVDFIADGTLEDLKTTSCFTFVNNTKDQDYILQGSIYRWLAPEIITSDYIQINYLFKDWAQARAKIDKNYPPSQIHSVKLPLLSLAETESYLSNKLSKYYSLKDADQDQLPLCTDDELWRRGPHWKYYKNPNKMSRSTKNFDSKQEAYVRLATDNNVGIVVEKPGEVVACKYCPAFAVCEQKDALISAGSLIL